MENWKLIQGYKYNYHISDLGNVKNGYGKPLTPIVDKDGYLRIRLVDINGVRKFKSIHRLVAQYFIGHHSFEAMTVNHKDGNKQNNHLTNLEIVTMSQNNKHAYNTGLKNNKGENHGKARFSEEDILEMRRLYSKGKKQTFLAKFFDTTQARVSEIVSGKTWKHI